MAVKKQKKNNKLLSETFFVEFHGVVSIIFFSFCLNHHLGNGLMDEKEFRQWIQRIQSLQEESSTP